MKERHARVSLGRLCLLFGITRQSYYQHYGFAAELDLCRGLVFGEVLKLREKHPRMGGRKLYELLEGFMLEHGIKMGRDSLFELLASRNLLVRRRRRATRTTDSSHWLRKWPNLIRGFIPDKPNRLWVSDITYWAVGSGFLYVSLITDAFSHKIVGWQLSGTLAAHESVKALEMALAGLDGPAEGLTHHSDRGVQYCSAAYVKMLGDNGIKISMTENGDPLENAVAERVNGIVKGEYLECYQVGDFEQARLRLERTVELYNRERPHMSIANKTPEQVHQSGQQTERVWKSYYAKKEQV